MTLLPAMLRGFLADAREGYSFELQAGLALLGNAQALGLVLYLVWRSGEPWKRFGLESPRWVDVPRATGLILIVLTVAVLYWRVRRAIVGPSTGDHQAIARLLEMFKLPDGPWGWALLALVCFSVGIGEELLARGFLLVRLEQWLRSKWTAIALSSALFGVAHSYKGAYGMFVTGATSALYGYAFTRWRRIWPLALAHATQDFAAFTLIAAWYPTTAGAGG